MENCNTGVPFSVRVCHGVAWGAEDYLKLDQLIDKSYWDGRLVEHIAKDDKVEFVSHMNWKYNKPQLCQPHVMYCVCVLNALKCATALFDGETHVKVDLHASFSNKFTSFTPLHSAATFGCSILVDFLLRHGALTGVRCFSNRSDHQECNNMLPLNVALWTISNIDKKMSYWWNLREPIFAMIIRLSRPKLRTYLETVSFLVESTKEVDEEIYRYVIEGKVVEIATLLIVARDKVMSPSIFKCSDGSLNLREFLSNMIMFSSMQNNGENLELGSKCENQLAMWMHMLQLVEVFERIGDKILAYLKQEHRNIPKEQADKEVAWMLHDAGFSLWYEDYVPQNRSLVPMAIHDHNHNHNPDSLQLLIVALKHLSIGRHHQYVKGWNAEKSIFKLIYVLCLPKLKGMLEHIRSLASKVEDIRAFGCLCLKEGKLFELAVLLMVAREKLISMTPESRGTFGSEGSMGIHQCLLHEIQSVTVEETSLMIRSHNNDLLKICKERKAILSSAYLLLEVFERGGKAIDRYTDAYVLRITTNGRVAEELAVMLKKLDFILKKEDPDLHDMDCLLPKMKLKAESREKLCKLSERFPLRYVERPAGPQIPMFSFAKIMLLDNPCFQNVMASRLTHLIPAILVDEEKGPCFYASWTSKDALYSSLIPRIFLYLKRQRFFGESQGCGKWELIKLEKEKNQSTTGNCCTSNA
ncbi:hypothetical protein REPUB_Repub11eG0012200 [Reevesia pubescens]